VSSALQLLSPSSPINFTYIPLNHVDALTGKFVCSPPSMDCESTKFDSCLVHAVANQTSPLASNQRGLSSFLKCFEGPFANREEPTDPSRRRPCFEQSFGPGLFESVAACALNPAVVGPIEEALNKTRAPMYSRLTPNPGLFPHIFINGVHQYNNSWTALFRTLCSALEDDAPRECLAQNMTIAFRVHLQHPWKPPVTRSQMADLLEASLEASNLAASRILFPDHWNTTGDAGQPRGEPSYVNARPAVAPSLRSLTSEPGLPAVAVEVTMSVLAGLRGSLSAALSTPQGAADLFEWALRSRDLPMAPRGGVDQIRVVDVVG
jgi:hypothetical protein